MTDPSYFSEYENDFRKQDWKEEKELEKEDPVEILEFIESVTNLIVEKAIPDKRKALTYKKAGDCLGVLGKIWNLFEYPPAEYCVEEACNQQKLMDMEGYVDEYQYLHLEAIDMDLTDVRVLPKYFVWLLSVDLSGNLLTNEGACPVTKLPNVVALRLNRNRFRDPYMPVMKHLQYLGLNHNKITSLHRIYHPNLETLDLNYNRVREVKTEDCWKLSELRQLELRGNHLRTTSGIAYIKLVNLYLAQNQITQLKGLELLVNLQRLHLRDNPLTDLSDFTESNSSLKYLNIRNCKVNNVGDIKNLSVLIGLRELIVKGNAFNPEPEKEIGKEEDDGDDEEEDGAREREVEEEDDAEMRIQILTYLPNLTRIDKRPVTSGELRTAKDMMETEE